MSSTIDGIHTRIDRESQVKAALDNPEVVEALKHGDIREVLRKLPSGVTARDVEDYLATQSRIFQNRIVQDYEIYAGPWMVDEPNLERDFGHLGKAQTVKMTPEEQQEFRQTADRHFKATSSASGGSDSDEPTDIFSLAQGNLDAFDQTMSDMNERIFETQTQMQFQKNHAENDKKIREIIAMVKEGKIEPEFIMIAITKSYMADNGTLFVGWGRKLMKLNDEMNQISKDLYKKDLGGLGGARDLQMAQSKLRDKGVTMQQLQFGIQDACQKIAGQFEMANSLIRTVDQARLNIRQNMRGT